MLIDSRTGEREKDASNNNNNDYDDDDNNNTYLSLKEKAGVVGVVGVVGVDVVSTVDRIISAYKVGARERMREDMDDVLSGMH